MLSLLLKIALGLGLGYVLVVILAWRFQDRLALPAPRMRLPAPRTAGLADGERVEVATSDGVVLSGWYLPARGASRLTGPAPGLIWFYGNMETVAALGPVIGWLRPPAVAVLALDYRGYGENAGRPSEAGLYLDAEAAWAYLASRRDVDPARIAVYGRSVGSVPALYLATTHPVRSVVLDSPFSSAADMARLHYGFLPPFLVRLSMNNLERARRLEAPLLVFHGTADRIAPLWMGQAVAQAGRARRLVAIEGAGHNETYDLGGEAYRHAFFAFLAETLTQPHEEAAAKPPEP